MAPRRAGKKFPGADAAYEGGGEIDTKPTPLFPVTIPYLRFLFDLSQTPSRNPKQIEKEQKGKEKERC